MSYSQDVEKRHAAWPSFVSGHLFRVERVARDVRRGRHARDARWVALLLALGVVLMPLIAPVAAQPPPLPHAFYGTLEVAGRPAPAGVGVEGRGEGVITGIEGNPIVTTVEGHYGEAAGLAPKLIVQGRIRTGAAITFYVNGVQAQCAEPGKPWQDSYPYAPGEITQLNLRVVGEVPTMVWPTATPTPTRALTPTRPPPPTATAETAVVPPTATATTQAAVTLPPGTATGAPTPTVVATTGQATATTAPAATPTDAPTATAEAAAAVAPATATAAPTATPTDEALEKTLVALIARTPTATPEPRRGGFPALPVGLGALVVLGVGGAAWAIRRRRR